MFTTYADRDALPPIARLNDLRVQQLLDKIRAQLNFADSTTAKNPVVIDLQTDVIKRKNESLDNFLTRYNDLAFRHTRNEPKNDPKFAVDMLASSIGLIFKPEVYSQDGQMTGDLLAFLDKQYKGQTVGDALDAFTKLPKINDGVSPEDYESLSSDKTPKTDLLGMRILRLIAAVPQNDLLWNRVITNLFLNDCLASYKPESRDYLLQKIQADGINYLHIMSSLVGFQTWIAKKIFLPPITGAADSEFDNLLDQLSEDTISSIMHTSILMVTEGPTILTNLDQFPDQATSQRAFDFYSSSSPFNTHFTKPNEEHPTISLTYPELMKKNLRRDKDQITKYWEQNFGNNAPVMTFLFDKIVGWRDEEKERSEQYISFMKDNLGETFMQRLDQKGHNLDQVNQAMMEKIDFRPLEGERTITFSAESFPSIMGFSEITYVCHHDGLSAFSLNNHGYPVEGVIDHNKQLIRLTVNFDESNQGLENIIKNIGISYLTQDATKEQPLTEPALPNPDLPIHPYLVPASDEFQSKYQIKYQTEEPEADEVPSEKVENLERKMQFAKGEVFEQLVGTVLSYTHPDELVLPQYCLDVHPDGNKVIYGDRVDFRVGIELFEVKWGYHTENINITTEKQISLLSKQPQNNKFLYHLVRMEETTGPNKPLQLMNHMFRENMLTHAVRDYETQDIFETITLAVMELASSQNSTQSIENIQLLRNYLYNEIQEANLLTGQERQIKIKQDLTKLAAIITQPDAAKAFDDLNSYLLTGNNEAYSPNEATFEWEGVLYTKKIGGSSEANGHQSALSKEASAKPVRARGYRGMYSPRLRGVETYLPIYVQKIAEYEAATDDAQRESIKQQLVQLKTHFHQPEEAKIIGNEKLPDSVKLQPVLGSDGQPIINPLTGRNLYTKTWVEPHFIPGLTQEEKNDIQVVYENRFANSSPLVLQDYLKSWIFPEAA